MKKKPTSQKSSQQGSNAGSNLNMALRYAAAGIAVVPIHGTREGRCTCGNPACDRPGNHPRTEHGVHDATTDSKAIKQCWEKWPKAKIGIAFGGPTKMLGVAIDGAAGWTSFRALSNRNGKLARTVTIVERDDREILVFRCGRDRTTGGKIAEGLRLLGDGDFKIAPSPETSTANRQFRPERELGDIEIARAPVWLSKAAAKDGVVAPVSAALMPAKALTVMVVPASEIEPEEVTWIWPGVVARGGVTGLVGYPGLGKSQVSIDIAAAISTGRPWPGGAPNGDAGHVLILSAEDNAAHTIVPRLIAAGADLAAVRLVKAVKEDGGDERAFSLADDLGRLEREHDLSQVRLLIVDPATAYLGKANGHINRNQGSAVRPLLDRLTAFAARHDLGVLIISHLSKSTGSRALMRVLGSQDWVAVPRAVHLLVEESGSNRRLLLPLKNNLAPDRIGYAFELESKIVGEGISTSAVVWSDDPVTISADEALAAAAKKVTSGAVEFLQQVLREGPMDQAEVVRLGEEAGYTAKSLRTAREKSGVTPKREGGLGAKGRWVWYPAEGAEVVKLVVNNDGNLPPGDHDAGNAGPGDNDAGNVFPATNVRPTDNGDSDEFPADDALYGAAANGDGGDNAGRPKAPDAAIEQPDDSSGP